MTESEGTVNEECGINQTQRLVGPLLLLFSSSFSSSSIYLNIEHTFKCFKMTSCRELLIAWNNDFKVIHSLFSVMGSVCSDLLSFSLRKASLLMDLSARRRCSHNVERFYSSSCAMIPSAVLDLFKAQASTRRSPSLPSPSKVKIHVEEPLYSDQTTMHTDLYTTTKGNGQNNST